MRLLFVLLAVVVAVLAFIMNSTWLFALAGGLLLVALVLLVMGLWKNYQARQATLERRPEPDDELRSLGIVDIRPRTKEPDETVDKEEEGGAEQEASRAARAPSSVGRPRPRRSGPVAATPGWEDIEADEARARPLDAAAHVPEGEPAAEAQASARDSWEPSAAVPPASADERERVGSATEEPAAPELPPPAGPAPAVAEEPEAGEADAPYGGGEGPPSTEPAGPVMGAVEEAPGLLLPYLQALRAALGAHTVALMRQDDAGLEYGVEALISEAAGAQTCGVFSTRQALFTASMSSREATVVDVEPGAQADFLGYYGDETPPVRQVALAPVPLAHPTVTYFLLVDTLEPFGHGRAQPMMARFADLLGYALRTTPEAEALLERPDAEDDDDLLFNGAATATTVPQDVDADAEDEDDELPPRRLLIDEEMRRARQDAASLALALVYLNRAEEIAARGAEEVGAAEETLADRLRAELPEARVEPFGELTYGVFLRGDVDEVEERVMRLHRTMAAAEGTLAGGTSIGLAMMRPRHTTPDALRDDATTALREAYTSGTCTVLE